MKFIFIMIVILTGSFSQAIEVKNFKVIKPSKDVSSIGQGRRGPGLFSAGFILMLGQGKMGNDSNVQKRSMLFSTASVFMGLNWRKLRIGPQYEYMYVGQTDDPADYSNQNISGASSNLGARLDYYDGKNSFGVIYRLQNQYKLDLANSNGEQPVYKAQQGYQIQYYRHIKKKIGFVVDYTIETFDESFDDEIKWDRVSIGLIISNF